MSQKKAKTSHGRKLAFLFSRVVTKPLNFQVRENELVSGSFDQLVSRWILSKGSPGK
jgi:hypothetical protein